MHSLQFTACGTIGFIRRKFTILNRKQVEEERCTLRVNLRALADYMFIKRSVANTLTELYGKRIPQPSISWYYYAALRV
jgi:hypothetical protein